MRFYWTLTTVLALGACSTVSNPAPVATYDGTYAGSRQSNDPEACGIELPVGKTSATIAKGKIRINLFNADTKMEGTVGEDGAVRASGFWPAPHSFIAITVLRGTIAANTLTGTASNFRCSTDVKLSRQPLFKRSQPTRKNSGQL